MLRLERINDEVYCEGKKLRVVKQATKGVNCEYVIVDGLEGSEGQKHYQLKKLQQGMNEVTDLHASNRSTHEQYTLTAEEQSRVDELKAEIDSIIAAAKARYVKPMKITSTTQIANMTKEQKEAAILYAEQLLAKLKA